MRSYRHDRRGPLPGRQQFSPQWDITVALISTGFLALGWIFRQVWKSFIGWRTILEKKVEKLDEKLDQTNIEVARIAAYSAGYKAAYGAGYDSASDTRERREDAREESSRFQQGQPLDSPAGAHP